MHVQARKGMEFHETKGKHAVYLWWIYKYERERMYVQDFLHKIAWYLPIIMAIFCKMLAVNAFYLFCA